MTTTVRDTNWSDLQNWKSNRWLRDIECDARGGLKNRGAFYKDLYPNCVYFVQADAGGPVKIGTGRTSGIRQRLSSLQTGNPYRLVVRRLVSGDERLERTLHTHFQSYRLVGEWFVPRGDLIEIARCIPGDDDRSLMRGCFEAGYKAAERETFWRGYRYGRHELAHRISQITDACDIRDGDDVRWNDSESTEAAYLAWSDSDDGSVIP